MREKELRIVFMGTPEFAVPSLDIVLGQGYRVCAVVTAPDKPSGRGLKVIPSPVKTYALEHGIKVLQPEDLSDPGFISELIALRVNLQVVVAFRKLPREVWMLPAFGTFNLHGSLLPQFRGAAPIQWAVIHGETETGLTTFFLNDRIDQGEILFTEKTTIGAAETAGELHDRLKVMGAGLTLRTIKAIESGDVHPEIQKIAEGTILKKAPKIFRDHCQIRWNETVDSIYNLVRGLNPAPGAFSLFVMPTGETVSFKLLKVDKVHEQHEFTPGTIRTDNKSHLQIAALDGWVLALEIQPESKKKLNVSEYLRGYPIGEGQIVREK